MAGPSRTATIAAVVIGIVFFAGSIALTASIPVEKVLGTKIYLPIFHGASTWVDIMLFLVVGIVAIVHLIGRRIDAYAWEVGFRTVAAPLWLVNTVLGLIAALQTWDFSASQESPLQSAMKDPRLSAQIWLLVALGLVLVLMLLLDKLWQKSLADIVFVGLMAVLLGDVLLDPAKRALHPDNPVLNSGWDIKGPFFGVVACLLVATVTIAWLVRSYARKSLSEKLAVEAEDEVAEAVGQ